MYQEEPMSFSKLFGFFTLFLLLAAIPITIFMVFQQQEVRQHAAEQTIVRIIPNAQKATAGAKFFVDIDLRTGTAPINGIQMNMTYPAAKVSVASIDPTNSAFENQTEEFYENGLITLSRSTSNQIRGTAHVIRVNFKVQQDTTAEEIKLGATSVQSADNRTLIASSEFAKDEQPRELTKNQSFSLNPLPLIPAFLEFLKTLKPF